MEKCNIIICGCFGNMGTALRNIANEFTNEIIVTGGIDKNCDNLDVNFPVFKTPDDIDVPCDVIIDFSSVEALNNLVEYTQKNYKKLVLCVTGYQKEHIKLIKEVSEHVPVIKSSNTSLVVNLLIEFAKKAKNLLNENFDIEILEKHHRNKADAPSGTALMMADAISNQDTKYNFGRNPETGVRKTNEIGIHSLRGGDICGEHEIIFLGPGEVLSMRHMSSSRNVFARGAYTAALFINNKNIPGIYSMKDVLGL
ncbi:MAG: 4-hydroxy-tetrahydrodipicolinate reductase [Candidatus Improbicoccus devescovinae]|nr:MAG: 4-hydroxy-tetrahydrodipicolinate reductase [Candidatus Improbicoccus devescovinae]